MSVMPPRSADPRLRDSGRAAAANARYRAELGWDRKLPEVQALIELPGPVDGASFASAAARWQSLYKLATDGIVGPLTWERMRKALGLWPHRFRDPMRVVRANARHRTQLGWGAQIGAVVEQLALPEPPDEVTFAVAVMPWQKRYELESDGILGPRTWQRMRSVIVSPRPPAEGPPLEERPAPHPPPPRPPRPHPPRPHPPRPRPPRPQPPRPAPPTGTGCPPGFFRNEAALATVPLAPATPVAIDRRWPQSRRAIAATYNRLGGLIDALARRLGVDTEAALAVWFVESGGRTHTPGRAIIRFENHLFFRAWGRANARVFDQHFRFGGHGGQPGRSFEGHQMRDGVTGPFRAVHTGNQDDEYAALALAQRLGGDAGVASISIGGPQILTSNFAMLGYPSARAMHDAFQADERAQVIGFFDFVCRSGLQPAMRQHRWEDFARVYNGPGNTVVYGGRLRAAHGQAAALGLGGRRP